MVRFAFVGEDSIWTHRMTEAFPACCSRHYRLEPRFLRICEVRYERSSVVFQSRWEGCYFNAQYTCNRPRTPFTNRSKIARKTRANDAPAIAPGEEGLQGLKKILSPPVVWKYGIIWLECPLWVKSSREPILNDLQRSKPAPPARSITGRRAGRIE